jgi:hypothetical protein
MSNDRYLEIDSTYRDRTKWPLAGEFEIPISQTGTKGKLDAVDPNSNASTSIRWRSNRFSVNNGGNAISFTVDDYTVNKISSVNDLIIIIGISSPGEFQTTNGYYNNIVARLDTNPPRAPKPLNRIISYTYLGNDRAEFIFNNTWSTINSGDTIELTDPTDLTYPLYPLFFIPNGKNGVNSYVNTILYNETRNQYRKQKFYNSSTGILTVDTSGSLLETVNSGPVTNWDVTDTYSIRNMFPISYGNLTGNITNNPTTKSSFILPLSASNLDLTGDFLEIDTSLNLLDESNVLTVGGTDIVTLGAGSNSSDGFFDGFNIRMITGLSAGKSTTILSYNGTTKVAILSNGFEAGTSVGDAYFITAISEAKRIVKYIHVIGNAVGSGVSTSINLPSSASNINGDYNNIYIRITSGAASGDVRLIQNYNVSYVGGVLIRQAIPFTPFSGNILQGDSFEITSGIVAPPFSFSISTQNFFLLPFTSDNLVPFNYTGSNVSQQEMVCYEIKLLNLVLPNQILKAGEGGRITFYPYVYVELTNVSGSCSGLKNVIYSNNPNSSKVLFRSAIQDIANLVASSFLKIDGGGMTQTIKFKPNDNLKFSVRLPDGDIYNTILNENYSPTPPNPLSQISALFSLRRL